MSLALRVANPEAVECFLVDAGLRVVEVSELDGGQYRFQVDSGAIVNWWLSRGTLQVQGNVESAHHTERLIKAALESPTKRKPEETPKRAAYDWVLREFDPKAYIDSLYASVAECDARRVVERTAYRDEQAALEKLREAEAEASAPSLANKELGTEKAREKAALVACGKDREVLRLREIAREAQATHDSAEAGFEDADRKFKALRVVGELNSAILRFLAAV